MSVTVTMQTLTNHSGSRGRYTEKDILKKIERLGWSTTVRGYVIDVTKTFDTVDCAKMGRLYLEKHMQPIGFRLKDVIQN